MRIVGGRLRGRRLVGPRTAAIRPTSDRLREAIFDVLTHAYCDVVTGARVLDLFAGGGALGIEALSRGAAFALFVDSGAEALAIVRTNLRGLLLEEVSAVLPADATRLGSIGREPACGLAFLDPPYGCDLAGPTLERLRDGGWLAKGALAVVEESRKAAVDRPAGFALSQRRVYGDTQVIFLTFVG